MSRLFRAARAAAAAVRSLTGNPPDTEDGPYVRQSLAARSSQALSAQSFVREVARRLASLSSRRTFEMARQEFESQRGFVPPSTRDADWRPGAPPVNWGDGMPQFPGGYVEPRTGAPPVNEPTWLPGYVPPGQRPTEPPPPEMAGPRPPTGPQPPLPTPPPPGPESAGPTPPRPVTGQGEPEDEGARVFGRGAPYRPEEFEQMMAEMRVTPGSTNVYGYFFEHESRTRGILYVTFLGATSSGGRSGPGQTYAYYDVPVRKYHEFSRATAQSAGGAVWDYLRVRGSVWLHQHNYRLVQSHGDYVPRKATQYGFKTRMVARMGGDGPYRQGEYSPAGERANAVRRSYTRSTLPERTFANPNRGGPNRGAPNRGTP